MNKSSYLLGLAVVSLSGVYTIWGVHVDGASVIQGTWVSVIEAISVWASNFIIKVEVYNFFKALFYISAAVWLVIYTIKPQTPYAGVIAVLNVLAFLFISTAYWESRSWFGHSLVVPFWFLLFFSLDSFSKKKTWNSWPLQYGFVIYGAFYFLAGIKKLYESQWDWVLGDSLALWHSMMGQWPITYTPTFNIMAGLTVLIEVGAIFLLLSGVKSLCLLAAVMIIGLHLGIYFVLDFNFLGHVFIGLLLIYLILKENFHQQLSLKALITTYKN